MSEITIDAGTLYFNEDDLTATGLLVPYGVRARSNLGEFTVDPGVFEIPQDTTGASLNVEHQREDVVGGIERAWEQPEAGILAAFRFKNDAAGRKAFEEAKSGKRRHLSVEASGVKIRGGRAIAGRIFAAALVEKPAFDGATLLAAEDTATDVPAPAPADPEHLDLQVDVLPADITATTPAGDTAVYEPTPTPEAGTTNQEGSGTLTATNPAQAAPAPAIVPGTVPATLLASGSPVSSLETDLISDASQSLQTLYGAVHQYRHGAATARQTAETLLAALTDIKTSGSGTITVGGAAVQPDWVGKLFQGKRYQRKYAPLGKLGTQISLGGKKGYKLHRGTSASPVEHFLTDWAGNKTDIPSGNGWTEPAVSTRDQYAFGADLAREFFDLPGGEEVIEGFFDLIREDYLIWSDAKALVQFITTAGTAVAPDSYPTELNSSAGMLIQGIFEVSKVGDPSFALANETAFKELLYASVQDSLPEYITIDVNTSGEGTADGKVHVRYAPDSAFASAGLEAGTPAVIVGDGNSVEFDEIGETPLQIDALEIAKGGVDRAIHGYFQKFPVFPEGLVLVGTVDVP